MDFNYNLYSDTPEVTKAFFTQIINTKYDLEEISSLSSDMETKINIFLWQHTNEQSEPSKTSLWLLESRPSFIAAAYCYNNYVNAFLTDAFYDQFEKFDEDQKISMGLRASMVVIELQNTLLSIKSGLDRIVSIFSEFYKGISKNVTFGHRKIKEDGSVSYTGFLSFCDQMKEKDEVFSYIISEYDKWIADCVKPRDAVVHYNDFFNIYNYNSETHTEMPISTNSIKGEDIVVTIAVLKDYVDNYYDFMKEIIKQIWRIELSLIKNYPS